MKLGNLQFSHSSIEEKDKQNAKLFRMLIISVTFLCLLLSLIISHKIYAEFAWLIPVFAILVNSVSALIGYIAARHVVGDGMHKAELPTTLTIDVDEGLMANRSDIEEVLSEVKKIEGEIKTIGGPKTLRNITFGNYIEKSSEIVFIAQSWGNWVDRYDKQLTQFFENGGCFKLFVMSPSSESTRYFRELMEKRLGSTPADVVNDIQKTINELKVLKDRSNNSNSRLDIIKMESINWYFGAMFTMINGGSETDKIVLSVYGHSKQGSPWDLPAFLIDANSHPSLREWFLKDLESLID